MNKSGKGRLLQNLCRKTLESQGALVETAPNLVTWIPGKDGRRFPISRRHDFFKLWDLITVWPPETKPYVLSRNVAFVQVTVLGELSKKRQKILDAKWPASYSDCIAAYVGGRGRHFRVFRGPLFEDDHGEIWKVVK